MFDKGVLYSILAFVIPVTLMLVGFGRQGIHPFGNNQMLVVDLWHQYYPFFRVVREKLLTGGSFLYSWENGMGTNFISLISYYAASPLNWISIFFTEEHVRDALTFILIAKVGFSGVFFSRFLKYTYNRSDLSITFFSSMFALSSYTLGYYWNVMWFDTIALFPLVMLGVTALCREGKWKLYTISLALSLVSNYYIGYFTCLFTIFMFAAAIVIEGKSFKDYMYKLWLIFRSSVIGIALGGFMLLPAYFGLQLTYSANNTFPSSAYWYEKWTAIFANLISYNPPATKEGLPNFACGMLAVALIGVFLFSAGIKIREKIAMVLMLGLIAVSCNLNILNFIWHGFHLTNQIPYRFAFIFCFLLVTAGFRAYDAILSREIKIYQILLMLPGPAAVVLLNYLKDKENFAFTGAVRSSAIICGAYILIFAAVKLFPFRRFAVKKTMLNVITAGVVITELVSNTLIGVKTVGSSSYLSYPTQYENVMPMLDYINENEPDPFRRTEMTTTYTLNDSALYGYTGISQFSSSANVYVTRFFRRLGLYASEAGNRYYYRISTPVVNSMLGLKYIISRNGALSSEKMSLDTVDQADSSVFLYKNKYPLSLGYMMNSSVLDIPDQNSPNAFEYQNKMIMSAAGVSEPVLTPYPIKEISYNNMEADKISYGNYDFTLVNKGSAASIKFDYECIDGSYLYGYAVNGTMDTIEAKLNDTTVDSNISVKDFPVAFPMGGGQTGDTESLVFNVKDNVDNGRFEFYVYALSQDAFEKAYENLADEQLNITSFSDTDIRGNITVKEDGVFFMAMPYEKGWKVYADGKEVETFPVMNAMMGAKLDAGEHEIRIKYAPEGFHLGLCISAAALALFILLALLDLRKKQKQPAPENTQLPSDAAADDTEPNCEDSAPELSKPEEDKIEKPESDDSVQGN